MGKGIETGGRYSVVTEQVGGCGPPGEICTCPKTCLIVKGKN